ncbi:MAG: DASS family sodium-coupled anion symporter [Chloroherpetonaceae bacterium]|nr:DASS family sodium-coupled anion symporter [Chloroherpetonaceae bacterium]MCS7211723.1 DASS family sodium-coupled anion symporter [Chloroherpetonaceae bacterium]MDW8018661.1 DASS family sodium-coupled anion symporter [Chloroherpetonaceae bacterium]
MHDDSRTETAHYLDVRRLWPFGRNVTLFLLSVTLGLLAVALVPEGELPKPALYTLFILVTAVALWITEAIPPFAVGILIMAFLVFAIGSLRAEGEQIDVMQFVNTWSSPVIWLMLSGFFISEGLQRTGLDRTLFNFALRSFGGSAPRLLAGLMSVTAVISMIMSNTATTAMMIAAILPLLKESSKSDPLAKDVLLGIPAAAAVGGMGTIIGTPPNAITVGALANVGISINFVQWMLYGLPVAVALLAASWWILSRSLVGKVMHIPAIEPCHHEHPEMARLPKIVMAGTLVLTLLLWMTTTLHGIHVAAIGAIPIVTLTVSGIIRAKDLRALSWDCLMLVSGGLSLGLAIEKSGLAQYAANLLRLESVSPYLVILLLGYITTLVSNVMSNTAAATVLIPIGALITPEYAMQAGIVIGLSASTALLFPVSTPPNAIAFATGYLEQQDFRRLGGFFALCAPVLITLWVMLVS